MPNSVPFPACAQAELINPNFMQPLFQTDLGHKLIAYAAFSVIVGYFVMSKIADVDL